jgi:hypothetical protein
MNKIKKNDKPLNVILGDFIKKNNAIQKGLVVLDIENLFREKMGQVVSKYTKKIFLKGDVLYINVISSPLKVELNYSRESLKTLLNDAIGDNVIQEIRFI